MIVVNKLHPFICQRQKCGYNWYPIRFTTSGEPIKPKVCPACKSRKWDEPLAQQKFRGGPRK